MHYVLIIRAGGAGLSAARWCDELGVDTPVMEERDDVGGQLAWIHNRIDNYLGVTAENGEQLRQKFIYQTEDCDFDVWTGAQLQTVDLKAKRIQIGRASC